MKTNKSNCSIIYNDISYAKTDVIVNAANGCGYMGGKKCIKELKQGVAESLNYYTHGKLEKEALINARKFKKIPSFIFGTHPGNLFTTPPCGLRCKVIIHAVTMRYPGSKSCIKTVKVLINKIFFISSLMGYESIAIPCLGCGTGGLNSNEVTNYIKEISRKYPLIKVYIYIFVIQ